ncbi:minor capsid protein [Candidatus Vagococcus giribetii]|nr:minor capsid protein [Vagococcus sp. DIV0080]
MDKNKDLSYFVKREHKNADKINKRITNKSKEIGKILEQQEKVILKRIDKFYQDFGDIYGVTEEQAQKIVSQFDVDSFKERARKYVESKDTSYTANYDMRLYDTKQRISRLKLLLNEINLDIAEGYQKTTLVMNDILTTGQKKEIERQANLFKLPKKQIKIATEALLRETYTGTKFSSYWGKDLTNLYDILDVAIKGAIFNGQHPFKLKAKINKEFGVKDKWSKRLLITETTRMQSMVQIAAMKEAGFEYFRFIAERNACDKCGEYNNKVYLLDQWKNLVMIPPVHPHCRCSLVPATKEKYQRKIAFKSN